MANAKSEVTDISRNTYVEPSEIHAVCLQAGFSDVINYLASVPLLNGLPDFAKFDLLALGRRSYDVCLFAIEEAPRRYRFTFVGSRVVQGMNVDPTGAYLDGYQERMGPYYLDKKRTFDTCTDRGMAVHHNARFTFEDRLSVELNALFLPFTDEPAAGEPTRILGLERFETRALAA